MALSRLNIVHVVINEHSPIFAELIELLASSLRQLGVQVSLTTNQLWQSGLNLIVGHTCFLSAEDLRTLRARAKAYLVFQTEVVHADQGYVGRNQAYVEFLQGATQIWDYSPRNQALLAELGCPEVQCVPIGYAPSLERIVPANLQDIDVLFYGALSPRRMSVLQELHRRGKQVYALFGAYGKDRDPMIARSKIVLNMHQFDAVQLEQVRIAYLLNNKCFVISEPADCNPYGEGVVFCPYVDLADCCQSYLAVGKEAERARIAQLGHSNLQGIPMLASLLSAMDQLPAEFLGTAPHVT